MRVLAGGKKVRKVRALKYLLNRDEWLIFIWI
jgi:hypothetical protein